MSIWRSRIFGLSCLIHGTQIHLYCTLAACGLKIVQHGLRVPTVSTRWPTGGDWLVAADSTVFGLQPCKCSSSSTEAPRQALQFRMLVFHACLRTATCVCVCACHCLAVAEGDENISINGACQ